MDFAGQLHPTSTGGEPAVVAKSDRRRHDEVASSVTSGPNFVLNASFYDCGSLETNQRKRSDVLLLKRRLNESGSIEDVARD